MVTAKSKVGDGDFAGAGGGSARPRTNLNFLDVTSGERFEIEHGSGGSIDKKAHLGRADADFDYGEAVAALDGNFVGRGSGLCEKRGGEKRKAHGEDSSVHLTNYTPLDASAG